jgi:hypothetical protein
MLLLLLVCLSAAAAAADLAAAAAVVSAIYLLMFATWAMRTTAAAAAGNKQVAFSMCSLSCQASAANLLCCSTSFNKLHNIEPACCCYIQHMATAGC